MGGVFQAAIENESNPVDFWGGPLSNFARSLFKAQDTWGREHSYPTVEHYFAAWKATTPEDHDLVLYGTPDVDGSRPMHFPTPAEAKQTGRTIALRPDWEDIKYDVMLEGLRHKFQLPYYKEQLLATGDRLIREDSPTDFEWGYRNNGKNLLGKALMQIRDEIK